MSLKPHTRVENKIKKKICGSMIKVISMSSKCTNTQQFTNKNEWKSYNGKTLKKTLSIAITFLEKKINYIIGVNMLINIKFLQMMLLPSIPMSWSDNSIPTFSLESSTLASWSLNSSTPTFRAKHNKIDSGFTIQYNKELVYLY